MIYPQKCETSPKVVENLNAKFTVKKKRDIHVFQVYAFKTKTREEIDFPISD